MEGEHASALPGQEMHDGYQGYHAHTGYLDSAQAQAMASYLPDFAAMDPASQAAAMQHYAQHFPPQGAGEEEGQREEGPHSDTESELEEGVDAAQQRLSIATVDAQATKGDEAWTDEEEKELLLLVNDEEYRKSKLGETTTKWAPIARAFSRTVKAVKRKFDKLQNPDKEQRKLRSTRSGGAAPAQSDGDGANGGGQAMPTGNEEDEAAAAAAAAAVAAGQDQLISMYMGMDSNGMYQEMTEEQAAAHAAMQGGNQQLTAEQMAQYMAYGSYYGDPNAPDPNQQMDPVLLQQLAAQQAAYQGAAGAGSIASPRNDRVFWKQDEQQELLRIVQDEGYRAQVLGITEVNWDVIAKHLGRGKRSVQRKYDNLKGALAQADGSLVLPANDGKKWSQDEVAELIRLVEEPTYRMETLGIDKVDWRILGQHFCRSYESVSYKFSYVKNTGRTGHEGKPKKHEKAKHETSYKEMAIWALQQIGGEGTSGQICQVIVTNPVYAPQLDTAIVSGKKTLQRWKHGVRSALNAFSMFEKTTRVMEGEVVWHLVEEAVQLEVAAAHEKALRQRNKPLSGAQRRKLRKTTGDSSGVEGEAGQEEGAQQALAQMAQHRVPVSRKRKADGTELQVGEMDVAQVAQATAEAAAAAAAAAVGMGVDPQQMGMLAQSQMPLLQQIFDPNGGHITAEQLSMGHITAEQLSMLAPEHLALLQQQMDQGQMGQQLPVLPLVLQQGQTGPDGQPTDAATAQALAAEHAQMQAQEQGYDPSQEAAYAQHYDAAAAQAAYEQGHYQTHDVSHDPAAMAAQQQQLAEQYAAGMLTGDAAAAAQQQLASAAVVQGVQMGQPVGQGLDMMSQPMPAFDQYQGYSQYQQYQQYPYDPSQYTAADQQAYAMQQQMATYGLPNNGQYHPPPQ